MWVLISLMCIPQILQGTQGWDQFSASVNRQGTRSDRQLYKDEHYTTTIDPEFYRKNEQRAEKLAKEIEAHGRVDKNKSVLISEEGIGIC